MAIRAAASLEATPPVFLRLAGDPIRWRLLRELALSDRRVRELCALLHRPQNLVSYHLAQLRSEGLVSRRQSAADRRDSYYKLELARCSELLAASGNALHPALWLVPQPPREWPQMARALRPRVLFLCTGNSARSQIAEALLDELSKGAVQARSAGSHPKPLNSKAVRVMGARGIDIAGWRPKHLGEFASEHFDYVVSLCDRVREVCPVFPDHPVLIHWSVADPARAGSTEVETMAAFEHTAAELAARIPFLIELIAQTTRVEEAS
jgi:ArsR family transcriptional regulator, arsenate/arsenite/antimonite-responsive transcriptional repressor / arsenate reductase (thioredoxin)